MAVVEYLLEQRCDRENVGTTSQTPLSHAACTGRLDVAQLLMRWGANLDARSNYGCTPADFATANGYPAIADAIRAEEIRRRDHGFKRDRSTIPGTEEYEAARRPRSEQQQEEAADESDDDDDDDDDDDKA